MPDPQLIKLLFARQTLAEMTAGLRTQADLPANSDLGKLVRAQKLIEQGSTAEASSMLSDVMEHAQESRVALWAGKALRDLGLQPSGPLAWQALGVVFEVPMEGDADVLAVYRDNTVRFFSYGGAMAFYEPSAGAQDIHQLCQQMLGFADHISQNPGSATYPTEPDAPHITVLTVSGEVPVGAEAIDTFLGLGAQIIGILSDLQQH